MHNPSVSTQVCAHNPMCAHNPIVYTAPICTHKSSVYVQSQFVHECVLKELSLFWTYHMTGYDVYFYCEFGNKYLLCII